jgi:serine/threonine protein phosphatase PrpC
VSGDRRPLQVRLGFASERGPRQDNQDYVAAWTGDDMIAVVADGVGGHKGGREASETAVRGFIEAYLAQPQTLGVAIAASRALEPINQWIHAQGRLDPRLAGMATTFSALILRRRTAHVAHVGDSRIYRLSETGLERLTDDHVLGRGELADALTRAVGLEPSVRLDHRAVPMSQHDRFLLCSDGVHKALSDVRIAAILSDRATPEASAQALVAAALAAGGNDNATALVLDVLDLPSLDAAELESEAADLNLPSLPRPGDLIDGFKLGEILADGRYSRVFRGAEAAGGPPLALKFPYPRVAADDSYRLAFVREAWVSARVRSPYVGEVYELPPGRRSRLYSVMPFYDGETLEARLHRAPLSLKEGVSVAVRLARALDALHRVGVVHRDVKPENVILCADGGFRLVDLGVARAAAFEDFPEADAPGTPSFKAPELFEGKPGDGSSDLYAMGVTVYRAFTGAYPYGEVEPFQTPRFERYTPLVGRRPDLPAWLDSVIARAVALKPSQRFGDVIEFAHELEAGLRRTRPPPGPRPPLYERDPLLVWKLTTLLFALISLTLALVMVGLVPAIHVGK